MRIRKYTPGDLDALRHMHAAQGFGYPLPDLDSPMFVSKLVLEEDLDDTGTPESEIGGREASERSSPSAISPQVASAGATSSRVTMAILQRLTAETYLLHDPADGTPRIRWERFLALHDAARNDAAAHGLDDVQAFLPPRIALAFGRRLARLGWARDPWPCFSTNYVITSARCSPIHEQQVTTFPEVSTWDAAHKHKRSK